MTNPNDPWGPRPEDAPTEHLGPQGPSGAKPAHTSDYADAYGQGPGAPTAYPATEQLQPWAPPAQGHNQTREFPPYDTQWGAYESGYGDQWAPTAVPAQGYGAAVPPPGAPPPGTGQPGPPQQPKSNKGLWIGLALGVVLLIAVIGVVAGAVVGRDDSSSSASSTGTVVPATGTAPSGTPRTVRPTIIPSIPGFPGIEGLGAQMGTITTNEGGTLTLSTLSGGTITVHTDAKTQVISLTATTVAELPPGDLVMVQGDKQPDGSIKAEIIVSTSLPK